MTPKTIAVDVDDVCADLLTAWLDRYNRDYKDCLCVEDVDQWDLSAVVVPSCGSKIFGYLNDPTLYADVRPMPHALAAVERMRRAGHRVLFVTSCVVGSVDTKVAWLIEHGFLPNERTQPDFVAASDKGLVRADFLVDDHVKNVENTRGTTVGVLIERPHNRNVVWGGERAADLLDAVDVVFRRIERGTPNQYEMFK